MTEESRFLLALQSVPGLGGTTIKSLLSHFGKAETILNQSKFNLLKVNGIGHALADSILQKKSIIKADNIIKRCKQLEINIVDFTNPLYPKRLLHAFDAPLILFTKGSGDLNKSKMIAIVGTRKATEYGLSFTEDLVRQLTRFNISIVSGLAYGIDIKAHRSSLIHGIPTIGVLASGLNHIYPTHHYSTAKKMLETGLLVSEYPPDELPDPKKFPARNRIIAALCDGIVVIEAAIKGGALITAYQANDYNREVFALPGDINRPYSIGTNHLIKTHKARIITNADDIAYSLGWENKDEETIQYEIPESMDEEAMKVYKIIRSENCIHIDKISWLSSVPPGKLASILLNLEFNGFVNSLPGKKFKLSAKRIHV